MPLTVIITTPSDTEIVITRTFNAPARLLFDALLNPKYIPQWMLGPPGWTMPVCHVDPRVGGNWHFVWRHNDGREMAMTGTYLEISPPLRIVHTESWGEGFPETRNTYSLSESLGKTTLTGTILYPNKAARDAALKTGMANGIDASYLRLADLLTSLVNQPTV